MPTAISAMPATLAWKRDDSYNPRQAQVDALEVSLVVDRNSYARAWSKLRA